MQALINYFKTVIHPSRDTFLFALRTIVAGLLTLYLAFIFDLDQPKWALMTVFIVSTPLAGMSLQKSFSQVLGALVGAAFALILIMIFPQSPLPFIVLLSLWLGLCTAGGTLLRYTDSHAFVLSGFTAVIVAMLAQPDFSGAFSLAITRVTETLLGVVCVAVVSLLFARPQAVAQSYFAKVGSTIRLIASHAAAAIRTDEDLAAFRQRQIQLFSEISAIDGLRRHLYFDAPRLRDSDAMIRLLGNKLVLMASRLMIIRQQRTLVIEHWQGELPAHILNIRARELAILDALAEHGQDYAAEARAAFQLLSPEFEHMAYQLETLDEPLPAHLRPIAWALRWEQAQMLKQLDEIIALNDAIQRNEKIDITSSRYKPAVLHLDFNLAAVNAIRAFLALLIAGLIWIETGWDGARSGMVIVSIMCSMMATFPRPLLASQNFTRGFGLALVFGALYQFLILPSITDFEMLALSLVPFLYVVAVGLASPVTAGIAMGLGLQMMLLLGLQNIGVYHNDAGQFFEFTGGYLEGCLLSLLIYTLVFPFNPSGRIQQMFDQSRLALTELLRRNALSDDVFDFESLMADRLAMMTTLLPATSDKHSVECFEANIAFVGLGVALNKLNFQSAHHHTLPESMRVQLQRDLQRIAGYIRGGRQEALSVLLADLSALGHRLDELHESQSLLGREALQHIYIIRVSLLIIGALLLRYQTILDESKALHHQERAYAH